MLANWLSVKKNTKTVIERNHLYFYFKYAIFRNCFILGLKNVAAWPIAASDEAENFKRQKQLNEKNISNRFHIIHWIRSAGHIDWSPVFEKEWSKMKTRNWIENKAIPENLTSYLINPNSKNAPHILKKELYQHNPVKP